LGQERGTERRERRSVHVGGRAEGQGFLYVVPDKVLMWCDGAGESDLVLTSSPSMMTTFQDASRSECN
jgi:hypothetical protein